MAKSQLNQLSKRQILESLMAEQNQSNVTLSRLITSVARAMDIDPTKLAEMFIDDKGNQDYVETFNKSVRESHVAAHKESGAIAGEETAVTPPEQVEPSAQGEEPKEEDIR